MFMQKKNSLVDNYSCSCQYEYIENLVESAEENDASNML